MTNILDCKCSSGCYESPTKYVNVKVIDNLESDSSTWALSSGMGKELKDMIQLLNQLFVSIYGELQNLNTRVHRLEEGYLPTPNPVQSGRFLLFTSSIGTSPLIVGQPVPAGTVFQWTRDGSYTDNTTILKGNGSVLMNGSNATSYMTTTDIPGKTSPGDMLFQVEAVDGKGLVFSKVLTIPFVLEQDAPGRFTSLTSSVDGKLFLANEPITAGTTFTWTRLGSYMPKSTTLAINGVTVLSNTDALQHSLLYPIAGLTNTGNMPIQVSAKMENGESYSYTSYIPYIKGTSPIDPEENEKGAFTSFSCSIDKIKVGENIPAGTILSWSHTGGYVDNSLTLTLVRSPYYPVLKNNFNGTYFVLTEPISGLQNPGEIVFNVGAYDTQGTFHSISTSVQVISNDQPDPDESGRFTLLYSTNGGFDQLKVGDPIKAGTTYRWVRIGNYMANSTLFFINGQLLLSNTDATEFTLPSDINGPVVPGRYEIKVLAKETSGKVYSRTEYVEFEVLPIDPTDPTNNGRFITFVSTDVELSPRYLGESIPAGTTFMWTREGSYTNNSTELTIGNTTVLTASNLLSYTTTIPINGLTSVGSMPITIKARNEDGTWYTKSIYVSYLDPYDPENPIDPIDPTDPTSPEEPTYPELDPEVGEFTRLYSPTREWYSNAGVFDEHETGEFIHEGALIAWDRKGSYMPKSTRLIFDGEVVLDNSDDTLFTFPYTFRNTDSPRDITVKVIAKDEDGVEYSRSRIIKFVRARDIVDNPDLGLVTPGEFTELHGNQSVFRTKRCGEIWSNGDDLHWSRQGSYRTNSTEIITSVSPQPWYQGYTHEQISDAVFSPVWKKFSASKPETWLTTVTAFDGNGNRFTKTNYINWVLDSDRNTMKLYSLKFAPTHGLIAGKVMDFNIYARYYTYINPNDEWDVTNIKPSYIKWVYNSPGSDIVLKEGSPSEIDDNIYITNFQVPANERWCKFTVSATCPNTGKVISESINIPVIPQNEANMRPSKFNNLTYNRWELGIELGYMGFDIDLYRNGNSADDRNEIIDYIDKDGNAILLHADFGLPMFSIDNDMTGHVTGIDQEYATFRYSIVNEDGRVYKPFRVKLTPQKGVMTTLTYDKHNVIAGSNIEIGSKLTWVYIGGRRDKSTRVVLHTKEGDQIIDHGFNGNTYTFNKPIPVPTDEKYMVFTVSAVDMDENIVSQTILIPINPSSTNQAQFVDFTCSLDYGTSGFSMPVGTMFKWARVGSYKKGSTKLMFTNGWGSRVLISGTDAQEYSLHQLNINGQEGEEVVFTIYAEDENGNQISRSIQIPYVAATDSFAEFKMFPEYVYAGEKFPSGTTFWWDINSRYITDESIRIMYDDGNGEKLVVDKLSAKSGMTPAEYGPYYDIPYTAPSNPGGKVKFTIYADLWNTHETISKTIEVDILEKGYYDNLDVVWANIPELDGYSLVETRYSVVGVPFRSKLRLRNLGGPYQIRLLTAIFTYPDGQQFSRSEYWNGHSSYNKRNNYWELPAPTTPGVIKVRVNGRTSDASSIRNSRLIEYEFDIPVYDKDPRNKASIGKVESSVYRIQSGNTIPAGTKFKWNINGDYIPGTLLVNLSSETEPTIPLITNGTGLLEYTVPEDIQINSPSITNPNISYNCVVEVASDVVYHLPESMVESPKIICDDYRLSYGVNDADQGNIWPEWEYDPDLPKLNIINDGTYEITFSKGGACHFEIPKKDELVIKNIMYKSTGRRINIESITYQVNDPQKGLCDYSVWEFYSGTPTTIQFEVEWKNIIPYNSY